MIIIFLFQIEFGGFLSLSRQFQSWAKLQDQKDST